MDRPWLHFTGRWNAIKPYLADMVGSGGCTEYPIRIVDVGSCTGFFTLQTAHHHPDAEVIGVEGSVGIGNGTVGMAGSVRQILRTPAVQTHLRWINRLDLRNCIIAPEVWDYVRICELATLGQPICDVMFLMSVIHHIDDVSVQQYTSARLSRLDGLMDLMSKILGLAPRHFIELPNKPWMNAAYEAFGTQRRILERAAKLSGYDWQFKGPIYSADWFGRRELWVLEVKSNMPRYDPKRNVFPFLSHDDNFVGGNTVEMDPGFDISDSYVAGGRLGDTLDDTALFGTGVTPMDASLLDPSLDEPDRPLDLQLAGNFGDVGVGVAGQGLTSALMEPTLVAAALEPCQVVPTYVGEAVSAAPTSLLIAHLKLREVVNEAQDLLKELRGADHAGGHRMVMPVVQIPQHA